MKWYAIAVAGVVACSSTSTGGGTGNGTGSADASSTVDVAADAGKASDGGAPDAAAVADQLDVVEPADTGLVIAADAEPDTADAETDAGEKDIAGFFDDVAEEPDVPPPSGPVGHLYAHTKDTLYKLDMDAKAFVLIGKFAFDKKPDSVTDIAIDRNGTLYATTFKDLFTCGLQDAKCKWLATIPTSSTFDGTFNGLTFAPKGTVDPNEDALIGIAADGTWNHVKFNGSSVSMVKLGQYGDGWLSSGDAFSVEGIGTYATLKGKGKSDSLAAVDPTTGKLTAVIGETGVSQLFGFAWWAGVFYAFSNDGNVYTLDVATGQATQVKGITVPQGAKWWGAGVSTRANGGK